MTILTVVCGPRRSGRSTKLEGLGCRNVANLPTVRMLDDQWMEVPDCRPPGLETTGDAFYFNHEQEIAAASEIRLYLTSRDDMKEATDICLKGFLSLLTPEQRVRVKISSSLL